MVFRQCACGCAWFDVLVDGKLFGRWDICKVLEDPVARVDRGGLPGPAMPASLMRRLLWPFQWDLG